MNALIFISICLFLSLSLVRFVAAQGNHKINLFNALILRRFYGLVYHMFAIIQSNRIAVKIANFNTVRQWFWTYWTFIDQKSQYQIENKLFRYFRCSYVQNKLIRVTRRHSFLIHCSQLLKILTDIYIFVQFIALKPE